MTIIFDENVPLPLRQFFAGHEVTTVQLEGCTGIQNGELISRIDRRFDVLILADKNLRYQQKLAGRRIALIELPTNRWPVIRMMADRIVHAAENAVPGSYTILEP